MRNPFASHRHRPAAGGFTLVEIIISMSIVVLVLLTAMVVIRTSTDNLGFEMTVIDQQVKTRSVMDEIVKELRNIKGSKDDFDTADGKATNTVDGSDEENAVTFQYYSYNDDNRVNVNQRVAAGGNQIKYSWKGNEREDSGLNNGLDDDGNGLTDQDDGMIVREIVGDDRQTRVMLNNVPKTGFRVRKIGRRLALTIARKNDTNRATMDGSIFTTTIYHVTYNLKNE